jgi:valyl-tRNA synthetase
MSLAKRYDPQEVEPRLQAIWQQDGIYHFQPAAGKSVYSIDTPPATVSGHLHLGHVYSYTHPDLIARFKRMRGYTVFYPMGYDDNGLPTERLVEKMSGKRAMQIGRQAFIENCLKVSEQAEADYQALWTRLGLSIDWRYSYRTIDRSARKISQLSFIELARKGLAYRQKAPAIWCPECQTSIAQAEVDDLDRRSEFVTLRFELVEAERGPNGQIHFLPIATTRPELLPACVAIFIHPDDPRYRDLEGEKAIVPLFGQEVPILKDPLADPKKGTGAVMCCTFGDATDVGWWYTHHLPLVEIIGSDGRLTSKAGDYAGLPLEEARQRIKLDLASLRFIVDRQPTTQTVRVHERCDTPVEYIIGTQWFIRILDFKEQLLKMGEQVNWHPEHMLSRYRSWVENLNWDWCISRQRYFGVPIPVWYCASCGEILLAEENDLPVDPVQDQPGRTCPRCHGAEFIPEKDVLDTWATSSMSPQIVGNWLGVSSETGLQPELFGQVFPFSLRPQAHEIIRTWAFYTITKSHFHFDQLPWSDVLISGWGIAGEGMGKISKSRGGGPISPMAMLAQYSADAVRYWAASTSPGKDAIISEEKIQMGAKLITKLWNVARFSERFLEGFQPQPTPPSFSLGDRWILSRLQKLVRRTTELFEDYQYAAAKSEMEGFFWRELADNYLEMCKQRLYDETHPLREGARFALYQVLLALIQLFAPNLPFVTDEIYQNLFLTGSMPKSIHITEWPRVNPDLEDDAMEACGDAMVGIATAVRRYKSENNLPLGTELGKLQLATLDNSNQKMESVRFSEMEVDLKSITRARYFEIVPHIDPHLVCVLSTPDLQVGISTLELSTKE